MKKTYTTPVAEIFESEAEDFMVKASVGIGEQYQSGMVVEAKKNNAMFLDDMDDYSDEEDAALGCDFGSIW